MKKKLLSIMLCVAMVASMAVGCASKKESSSDTEKKAEFKVGFAIKTQDSPYFVALVKAVKELADKEGWKCTVLDAGGDTAKEAENMDTFVAQGMDLIFLDSVEPDACIPSIDAAAEAEIPVINLDSGVGKCNQCTTVYSDNKQNGRLCGKAYVEYLKANNKADQEIVSVLLSGVKGNVAGQERRMGLFAGIIEARTGCTEEEAWTASQKFEDELTAGG
ncbi:MAG: substrate-binding domain-containing protein, partial [Lachnospiraceae bacterium]